MNTSRKLLSFLLPVLLAAACDDCKNGSTDAGADLAARPDLAPHQPSLKLIHERDHLEAYLTAPRTVWADADRIYLASYHNAKLFVLGRDRAASFPLLETISLPANAVRGDGERLYVTGTDGKLRVFKKTRPLQLLETIAISQYAIHNPTVVGDKLYAGAAETVAAADAGRVYVSALNPDVPAVEIAIGSWVIGKKFGNVFEEGRIVSFDRMTGNRTTAVDRPRDSLDRNAAAALDSDGTRLIVTTPGCCGRGVWLHNPSTLEVVQTFVIPNANAALVKDGLLLVGREGGQVEVHDIAHEPSLVASVDLRQVTGHTGIEDIEIRSLWADGHDDLVFAGSSFGNDQSRGPDLPPFFVLEWKK